MECDIRREMSREKGTVQWKWGGGKGAIFCPCQLGKDGRDSSQGAPLPIL